MTKSALLSVLVIISSCSIPTHWQLNSLATGEKAFHSNRLRYTPDDSLFGIALEFVTVNDESIGYITSCTRRLGGNKSHIDAQLFFDNKQLEALLSLHEGQMKARLPDDWTQSAIQALRDGHEIRIMIDGIEQIVEPECFFTLYQRMSK